MTESIRKAMLGKAKPKAKRTPGASKPRKSATESKSPPKAGAKAKPGASEAKPTEAIEGAVLADMRSRERATGQPASRLIDQRIRDLADWRQETLARMRALILEADPEMIEERKWRKPSNAMAGVPVWSHHGIVCTGETYAKVVKLTFARGASVPEPSRRLTSSVHGNTRGAIATRVG